MPLKMDNLVNNFNGAKETNSKFVGLLFRMEGYPAPEVIINRRENFDQKLKYYQETYDENLNHMRAPGIQIVGFTYGNSLEELEFALLD